MKTPSKPFSPARAAVLLAVVTAVGLVGRALGVPVSAFLAALTLALVVLRVGVMLAAVKPPSAPALPRERSHPGMRQAA